MVLAGELVLTVAVPVVGLAAPAPATVQAAVAVEQVAVEQVVVEQVVVEQVVVEQVVVEQVVVEQVVVEQVVVAPPPISCQKSALRYPALALQLMRSAIR
nr:hypothetical protein [Collimonas arenae]